MEKDSAKKEYNNNLEQIVKAKTFITSDLHLGHRKIIDYCNRPFLNTHDMNVNLVDNWNSTVDKKDTVYLLGDLGFSKNRSTDYWLEKLNGNIIFIKGNHDQSDNIQFYREYILNYAGYTFLLSHRPQSTKKGYDWSIHGHVHNNNIDLYPFIDKKNMRINVSIELTNYHPINIDDLIEKIEE